MQQHRIIVLGAGYTGAIAAGRLARRLRPEDVAVTLVNAETDFVERVRMHQLAVGQDLAPRPLDEMFAGTGVELKVARVTGVDVDRKSVAVVDANGAEELAYDTLVYALGSGWHDQGVPGVAEHAHQIAGRPGALRLRERLAQLTAGQPVVVVGGGLTGVEAVTEIAEARPDLDVSLAARGGLGDWLSPKGRGHLRKVLGRLGVTVHEHTAVTGVEADRITTGDGGSVPAAVTVWTTGFAVHPIAKATALEVTDTGRIVVDGTMRSVSHPDVYAVGDAAIANGVGGKPLRMSCASGVPMAWQAADAVAARLTGGKLPNTPLRYFNQCISLGRKEGLIQYVTGDDRAVRAALTGRLAAVYKELICKGAAWGVANPVLGPSRRRRVVREREAAANTGVPANTGAAASSSVPAGSPVPTAPVGSTGSTGPGVKTPA
ncbi:NAD(P)/FAD-dependent oxidoreductase [Streptomyces sp. NPDC054884]|uniref:NAD(P)/FAD-dependent oxidoreductase n=1 Tax=Streptomyces sp. ME08-AFT2 TaxID=3028683 RepID=UPI0029A5F15E|nr:FAD-dependent oxidoreductase [Streptomyces sp. ME08-AFT2]MDX3309201.1 FAD-dependent oxidoreductase [Streptomyces sp. ME08-AFT2]